MTRNLIAATLFSGLLLGTALPAYAQVTDQTDQSEEDWRKSRKKRGSTDIYTPNTTTNGNGLGTIGDIKPISPVERLPSESRRHLMKKRAEAIANSPDGDISQAEYEPSEAAKSDDALMRDEKEAWEVITTDMEGAGGQATQPSQGGPNKVAVAGRNGTRPAPGSRGGSTATLQEIMDAIKSGRMGNGSGGGQGDAQGRGNAPEPGATAGVGTLPTGLPDGLGQGSQGSGTGSGSAPGPADGSASQGGGAASQGDGASQQSSSASSNGQGQSQGGQAAQDGSAQSQGASQDSGDASATADASSAGQPGSAGNPGQTRSREDMSPLERMRRSREEREAGGRERSASDYLGRGVVIDD